jgi:nucleoside-diphosphate-sugar epimerase
VVGASGFIGRRVVHALSTSTRYAPIAVSRSAARALRGSGIEAHDVDVTASGALEPLLAGVAAVVNCFAGAPEAILASSESILKSAAGMRPRPRVVHLSSLAAYGSLGGRVDESMPLRGDLDAYSAAKARTDAMAAAFDFTVTLRPGIVFGPGSAWWSDRIARLLVARRLGTLGAQGEGICNLVYVDDVAQAALRALHAPDLAGAFNLANPEPITWNEYFTRYARALHAGPVRTLSRGRLQLETKLLALPLKVLEVLLKKPAAARWNPLPPMRPWLIEICARSTCLDVTRASQQLGMQWTPLDTALDATADWFRAGGRTAL